MKSSIMRQFVVIAIVLLCCAVLSEGGRKRKTRRRWPIIQYPNTRPKITDMILRCERITDEDCRRWVRCRWGQIGTKCVSTSGECYCDCLANPNPEPEPEPEPDTTTAVPPTTTTVPPTTTTVPQTTDSYTTSIIIVD